MTTPNSPISNILHNDFWGTPLAHTGSHKSYRPITSLSYKINYIISGHQAFYFHLVNVLLHGLATFLFVIFSSRFLNGEDCFALLLSGILFALHPIHTEAVAGIVGRADLLSSIFTLMALLAYDRHVKYREQTDMIISIWLYFSIAIICSALALLSKELGISALSLCLLADCMNLFSNKISRQSELNQDRRLMKRKKWSLMFVLMSLTLMILLRASAMNFSTPKFAKADNPAAHDSSFLVRVMTFSFLPVFNAALLLCPVDLSFDWSMESIPLISNIMDVRNLISLVFYSLMSKTLYTYILHPICKQKIPNSSSKIISLSLCLIIIPFLPASNIFFYVGFVVAERILYLPSLGFCLLTAHAIDRITRSRNRSRRRKQAMQIAICCLLLFTYAIKTYDRNNEWKDEISLFKSGIKTSPAKGKLNR